MEPFFQRITTKTYSNKNYLFNEDPVINYQYLEKIVSEKFILVKKEEMIKNKQEQYPDFLAKTYVAYLFKRKL